MSRARRWMWILWPGFLMAIPAVGIVFTLIDPDDMHVSRLGAYTVGFFFFWGLGSACSALTLLLQRPSRMLNR